MDELEPLMGVGDLRFGMTPSEVRKAWGTPESVESSMDPGESVTWEYDGRGFTLTFEYLADRLTIVTQRRPSSRGLGSVIGRPEKEFWDLVRDLALGTPRVEEAFENGNVKDIVFDEADASVWSEDGIITSASVAVPYDDSDRPIWPNSD